MKRICDLDLGFSDAQNYNQRSNKKHFNDIFVKNHYLEDLLKSQVYFLLGEKGTGKTAFATYLANNEYKNTRSVLKFIENTDYETFYSLKQNGNVKVSDFRDIWKTILLLLMTTTIRENENVVTAFNRSNIRELVKAIEEYYKSAFRPEISNALKLIETKGLVAKLAGKCIEMGGNGEKTLETEEQQLKLSLYNIAMNFSNSLSQLKLAKNVILFIDGIDVRPSRIPYCDYLDCIKGLVAATWSLNTELFANIKDSRGRMKIVLSLRPDIYNAVNLQNATNKLIDNSVLLEWRTTYLEYESSDLYEMANKLLSYDQQYIDSANLWEEYFNWRIPTPDETDRDFDTAFIEFLKISLSRPRDIQRILKILQEKMIQNKKGHWQEFDYTTYKTDQFQNAYSEYFLGSLKDQLSFYYTDEDYSYFTAFFGYFENAYFTYDEYVNAYNQFVEMILNTAKEIPAFVEDKQAFLQMLYDSNIIAAIEETDTRKFYHFSYREKSATNISPRIPIGKRIKYRFHYGLYKKVGFGRY